MKKYDNGKYDNLIEMRVKSMEFEKEFKPFVIDMIKRRAYQYDFTQKEVTLDLERLTNSLKSITVERALPSVGGYYYPSLKKISINSRGFSNNSELYCTLTHELYHALAHEDGKDTMSSVNAFSGEKNNTLLELLVEKASHRTVFPVKTSNHYYNLNASGYQKIFFSTELICATFGINEQELLRNSIQGREGMIKFLATKSRNDQSAIKDYLDEFEMNLATIRNNVYRKNGKDNKRSGREENIAEALGRMKKACASMLLTNLENIPETELSKEKLDDLKYNFNKLNKVVKIGTKNIIKNKTVSFKRIDEISGEDVCAYANGLLQTEYLLNFEKKNPLPKQFERFKNWARFGNLEHFDVTSYKDGIDEKITLRDLGIFLPDRVESNIVFKDTKETIRRNRESQDKTDKWDNKIIDSGKLRMVVRKVRIKELYLKAKSFITRKPIPSLAPATNKNQEAKSEVSHKEKTSNFYIKQYEYNTKTPESFSQKRSNIRSEKSDDYDER